MRGVLTCGAINNGISYLAGLPGTVGSMFQLCVLRSVDNVLLGVLKYERTSVLGTTVTTTVV